MVDYIYAQPNLTSGLDGTLVEIATAVPSLTIGLLMFVFGMVFMGGMSSQKARSGYADIQMWAVMGSLSTLLVSLMLTLIPGLINLETLGIVIAINVMSGLWLFLSKGRGEI